MSDNDNSEKKNLNFGDVLKKVVSTGIGAAFMTEEAVKSMVSELPLPKDMINGLLQNAKSTKEEFVASIKNELKSYLDKIDASKEIEKVLENYDMEVNATISFKKKKKNESNP